MSSTDNAAIFGLKPRAVGLCLFISESILLLISTTLLLSSLFSSLTWLPFFMNLLFFSLQLTAVILFQIGRQKSRSSPLYTLPIFCFETVSLFWLCVWIYACASSIVNGFLWPLEWVGGPQSARDIQSHDVSDPNYVDPRETNPETQKAIRQGGLIMAVCMVLVIYKLFLWFLAKAAFVNQHHSLRALYDKAGEYFPDEDSPSLSRNNSSSRYVKRGSNGRKVEADTCKLDEDDIDFGGYATIDRKKDDRSSLKVKDRGEMSNIYGNDTVGYATIERRRKDNGELQKGKHQAGFEPMDTDVGVVVHLRPTRSDAHDAPRPLSRKFESSF